MGMKIKSAIGYGLNIKGMSKTVLNNRWSDEEAFESKTDEIIQAIRKQPSETLHPFWSERMWFGENARKKYPFKFENSFIYDDEFLGEDYLLFKPHPFGSDDKWHRSDDAIDYFVAGFDGEPKTIWKQSQCSIYPYVGLMKENSDEFMGIETYMVSCYMSDPNLRDTVIPVVPRHIMFFLKALELVPESQLLQTFMQIRPTYAQWWGC